MEKQLKSLLAITIAIVCLASVSAAQDAKQKYKELPNFYRVNQNLFRGAQPKHGGLQRLAQLGVKTILNLRDDDDMARAEGREATSLGLRYFNLPLSRINRPSESEVQHVLEVITNAENAPVFVHCRRGADRTGVIIAVYRMTYDHWTDEEALREARARGLFWWKLNFKDYIHDYYRRIHEKG